MSEFLESYQVLNSQIQDPVELATAQATLVGQWLASDPKAMFDELRSARPVFVSPRATIVTRHADVLEVLSRDDDFNEMLYTPRMQRVNAHFFLGMPNSPEYEREVSAVRLAAGRSDLGLIQQLVTREAAKLLTAVKEREGSNKVGCLDLVKDLARVVPARFVASYLGVTGPNERILQNWMRALFRDLFSNLTNDTEVMQAADKAATEVKAFLTIAIAERKAAIISGEEVHDDVMTRLINLQPSTLSLDNDGIRRNLTGLAVGAIETTNECVVNVMSELFDRPEILAAAQQAATRDDMSLQSYVLEALRFKPQHPFLYRICSRDTIIARGTPRETTIAAGSFVVAATWSAMFDDTVIDSPDTFSIKRSGGDYMLFGSGRHTCFGAHINKVQITAICRAVLMLTGLRRKEGDAGNIKYEGPFPDSFILEFDPVVTQDAKKTKKEHNIPSL